MQGIVTKKMREYGYILGEDKKEYFFDKRSLKNVQFDMLHLGQEVIFEEVEGSHGPYADDIYA